MKTTFHLMLISVFTSAIVTTAIALMFCAKLNREFTTPLNRLMVLEGFRSADTDGRLPRWSEVHEFPSNGDMQGNGIQGLEIR